MMSHTTLTQAITLGSNRARQRLEALASEANHAANTASSDSMRVIHEQEASQYEKALEALTR